MKELTEPMDVKTGGREDGKPAETTGNAHELPVTGTTGGEPTPATWSIVDRQKSCVLRVLGANGGNKTSFGSGSCDVLTSGKEEEERAKDKEEINELET